MSLICVYAVLLWAPPAAAEESPGVAEHITDLLAEQPEGEAVVVGDMLSGHYDTERIETELREEFSRLDVPFHVIVLPSRPTGLSGEELLAAVADRYGQEGLYAQITAGHSTIKALDVGVDLPVGAAFRMMLYEVETDTVRNTPQKIAKTYVDALLDPDVAERAHSAEEAWDAPGEQGAWENMVQRLQLDPTVSTGQANLGIYSGIAAGALLTLALLRSFALRQRMDGIPGRFLGRRFLVGTFVSGAVMVLAAVFVTFDPPQTQREYRAEQDALAEPPYVAGTDRVERVVSGWEDGHLYVDPFLTEERDGLPDVGEELAELSVPVRAAVMQMESTDESDHDPEVFAHALAHAVGEDGVYLVHDTNFNSLGVATIGMDSEIEVPFSESENADPATILRSYLTPLSGVRADPDADRSVPHAAERRESQGPEKDRTENFLSGLLPGLLIVGPLVGLALSLVHLFSVALLRGSETAPGRLLRPLAARETSRSIKALDKAEGGTPAVRTATREMDAALAALRDDPGELDLIGAVVLARRARARLAGRPEQADRAVCMVNPLHGPAAGDAHTSLRARAVPMCADCLGLKDTSRRPLRVTVNGKRAWHGTFRSPWVQGRYALNSEVSGDRR